MNFNFCQVLGEDTMKTMLVKFRSAICLPPTGVPNFVLPWILWALWTARNRLIFEDKASTPVEIATKGITLAKEWNQAQIEESSRQKPLPGSGSSTKRQSLPQDQNHTRTMTCRTDASWDKNSMRAGLAWIFKRNSNGEQRQGSETQSFVSSPLMAEALAIRSAITMAVELEIPDVKVFSDSSTLIRAINTTMQDKEIYGIITDIHQLSSAFNSISFTFLPRTQNQEADELAKRTLRLSLLSICNGPLVG